MDGPVPKEVLQHVDQHTGNLHKGIAEQSTRAGHPTTPAAVNPQDRSSLEKIGEALGEAVQYGADVAIEAATGKDVESGIRVVDTKDVGKLRLGRLTRLFSRPKAKAA